MNKGKRELKSPGPQQWYKLGPFTVFDIETTGMSPVRNRIVELAALKIDMNGIVSQFHTLVNPQCTISEKLSSIHGITNRMVEKAPIFDDVGEKFTAFAEGSSLVAHNARFDLSFLQESLARAGLNLWDGKTMDTIPLVKQAYPGLKSYSLQNHRTVFGLDSSAGPAHRAYADVQWTMEILRITMQSLLGAYK